MNVTNITSADITSVTGMVSLANDLSGGVFIAAFYFVFYIIAFLIAHSRTYDATKSAMASSFVMFVVALLMMLPGWVGYWFAVLPVVIMMLTLFAAFRE